MNDRDVKSKWLKKYQEEMELNREKQDREKNQRVLQEQEYLNKLRREMEEEKCLCKGKWMNTTNSK